MKIKSTAIATLALWLLAVPGFGQSAAEQLQKGIYTQETAGDLDGAIRIYRQIVNSATPDQRTIAAQAQFLLANALLRQGDLTGAAHEFDNLARNFSDRKDVVRAMAVGGAAAAVRAMDPNLIIAPLATVQNGRYHHNLTGVEFQVPPDWKVQGTMPSSDDGEMVGLSDSVFPSANANVWMIQENIAAADIPARLKGAVDEKIRQRHGGYGNYPDWQPRPGTIQMRVVGGKPAISLLADYTQNGEKMTEFDTWVFSGKTRAFFFAQAPASDMPAFQPRFEQIISSAIVP